ncbi:RNA polymerase sigma factor [Kineosporia succinea]|uniref:RNA polymerase sigma factor (Sigma-70 family) n=1 Tax=Kineosporia succinea TaxID=84632 RepID=A0ABT9NX69_9ACTN|nr:RNA polymerase sigma factor [Kineosporia succinea]MDP9825022.1 RNA polymerase sigma factor (sigma-70 family) [Kineosporia succinea]
MIHEEAFNAFVREQNQKFWRYAYFLTRNVHDAEEIYQSALTRISLQYWDERLADRSSREQVRYVLATISSEHKNLIVQRCRLRHSHCEIDELSAATIEPVGSSDPALILSELNHDECRQTYLLDLSDAQGRVVWLRAVEGYSVREVATMLSMKEGNVKSTYARALEKLRHSLPQSGTLG